MRLLGGPIDTMTIELGLAGQELEIGFVFQSREKREGIDRTFNFASHPPEEQEGIHLISGLGKEKTKVTTEAGGLPKGRRKSDGGQGSEAGYICSLGVIYS